MANTTISPNMFLPVPVVGTDPGPDWANNNNACLQIIDSHNHSNGSGVQIPPSGLNINSDLSFQSNNATLLRTARFSVQSTVLSGALDVGCAYAAGAGTDLYYNDGAGNKIRITQGGSVAGASGTITGLSSPASASYSTNTFIFQSGTNTAANLDVGPILLRNTTASSSAITLEPSPSLVAGGYTLVLPANVPSVQSIMTLDPSGNVTAPYTIDNTTLTITSGVIGVKAGGITTTQISSTAGITGAQISSSANIAGSQLQAFANIAGTQLASSTVTPGNMADLSSSTSFSSSFLNSGSNMNGATTSGTVSNSTTGAVALLNGRPLMLCIYPGGGTNSGQIIANAATTMTIKVVASGGFTISYPFVLISGQNYACGAFTIIDYTNAAFVGSHVFTAHIEVTGSTTFNNVILNLMQV